MGRFGLTVDRAIAGVLIGSGIVFGACAVARAEAPRVETLAPEGVPSDAAPSETAAPEAAAEPSAKTEEAKPEDAAPASAAAAPLSPAAEALKARVLALAEGSTDEEKKERAALVAFYEGRSFAPLLVSEQGLQASGAAIVGTLRSAADYGLDPAAFTTTALDASGSLEARAVAEVELQQAALLYARHARGGRIIAPSELLNSNLDRRPQLIAPADVLKGLAEAADAGEWLSETNPRHEQFEKLRERYLAITRDGAGKPKALNSEAKRLLANMEMWRWMAPNLGDMHMIANVPEFMIRLMKNGEMIHTERVVAGRIDKQTSIFSRPLKSISLRPMWRVPESIKVHELWPSMLRGGGLMRQYGLELQTKDGQTLDWRSIDWRVADIRDYEVVQPPGRGGALGVVKFSFPSQHTIFMHDTPDKWMFSSSQRTHSHGCLRLKNPVKMAELLLAEDKGWEPSKIAELIASGPLNNEVVMDKKIRMHITYFTAWADAAGKVKFFPDVYGHEKRVTLALDGKWDKIDKGRDHLAPVVPNHSAVVAGAGSGVETDETEGKRSKHRAANADFMSGLLNNNLGP